MEGLAFVRGEYLSIHEGCYLPRADLLGLVSNHLHSLLFKSPELKAFVPNLIDVDLLVLWRGERFFLFVSETKRAHIPTRGMLDLNQQSLDDEIDRIMEQEEAFKDVSDTQFNIQLMRDMASQASFAAIGSFPASNYTEEGKAKKDSAGQAVAKLIIEWATRRRNMVEQSRIFLSHRGVDKPLIRQIDTALRQLNLKTWLDQDDMVAGDVLVRAVDDAFAKCSAAVFFVTEHFRDAGVISAEIDRAIHEQAFRQGTFRVIPLVLAQHGGRDDLVPQPMKKLRWETVFDIEIVPSIVRALPPDVQKQVMYRPIKD